MRAVERRPGAAATLEIDLDLEHEAAGAVARQELLDRLGALAALPGRADTGIEGDEGNLEIATRKLVPAARAEVAADAPEPLGSAARQGRLRRCARYRPSPRCRAPRGRAAAPASGAGGRR
jgi:hypothetical protein